MKIYKSLEFFEKLKINPLKTSDIEIANQHIENERTEKQYDAFCEALNIDKNKNSLKLKEYNDEDCSDLFDGILDNCTLCSTQFEIALMLCIMLIEDNKPFEEFKNLGYKHYTGSNNPYDFSWFEEEDTTTHQDVLDIIQTQWNCDSKFRKRMKDFYDLVFKCCNSHTSVDDVWDFYENYNDCYQQLT